MIVQTEAILCENFRKRRFKLATLVDAVGLSVRETLGGILMKQTDTGRAIVLGRPLGDLSDLVVEVVVGDDLTTPYTPISTAQSRAFLARIFEISGSLCDCLSAEEANQFVAIAIAPVPHVLKWDFNLTP